MRLKDYKIRVERHLTIETSIQNVEDEVRFTGDIIPANSPIQEGEIQYTITLYNKDNLSIVDTVYNEGDRIYLYTYSYSHYNAIQQEFRKSELYTDLVAYYKEKLSLEVS